MHAYAHIVRYAAAENGEPDSSVIVAPVSSQTKADAEALLNLGLDADAEAVNNLVDVGLRGFPEHLPEPLHSCRDPHHALATEMTAFMIAYMLLHEIAHLELNHTPNNGRKQEVAADEWARRFFLERCDDHEDSIGCEHGRVREKRLLGLVIGHLWLISHDIAFGIPGDGSHPRACDRLSTLLGNSGVDANGLPWFIAMSGLEIYCRRLACLSLPRNYSSFREGYNSLVGSLTRAHWR